MFKDLECMTAEEQREAVHETIHTVIDKWVEFYSKRILHYAKVMTLSVVGAISLPGDLQKICDGDIPFPAPSAAIGSAIALRLWRRKQFQDNARASTLLAEEFPDDVLTVLHERVRAADPADAQFFSWLREHSPLPALVSELTGGWGPEPECESISFDSHGLEVLAPEPVPMHTRRIPHVYVHPLCPWVVHS